MYIREIDNCLVFKALYQDVNNVSSVKFRSKDYLENHFPYRF